MTSNGYLPAKSVQTWIAESGSTIDDLLLDSIATASGLALPALSGFRVGAAAQGVSGAVYLGCNIEFRGLPLSQTIHAEQCAVANAAFHGETGILKLAVSAPPCGYCRQFLFELASADRLQILLAGKKPALLTDFLPVAFGPGDLGVAAGLLGSAPQALELSAPGTDIAEAALRGARHAYAPYTGSLAGAALKTKSGRIFAGGCMENAAFNPGIAPMQAAIAVAVISGAAACEIAEAALVEAEDSKLGYLAASRAVLREFCPDIPLQEFRAHRA